MDKKNLTLARNLLYKMSLIGFVLFFAGVLFCLSFPEFMRDYSMFVFGVRDINNALLILLGVWETMIITFFLIPALALHWHLKK